MTPEEMPEEMHEIAMRELAEKIKNDGYCYGIHIYYTEITSLDTGQYVEWWAIDGIDKITLEVKTFKTIDDYKKYCSYKEEEKLNGN